MTNEVERRTIKTYCCLCIARCGAVATVEAGRLTSLDPDPDHPTGKALCAKGRAAPELFGHSDRLLHPLKRTRPKGDPDPGWTRISWDEALGLTSASIKRIAEIHGPEALAVAAASPASSGLADAQGWIRRLMKTIGTPNYVSHRDVCGWGRALATSYTFGVGSVSAGSDAGAMPEIEKAGCLILWGYNPSMTRLSHATLVAEAVKRGMRLIVIDPRRVGLASKADLWISVRPGTDGALALGIANVMIERGWYDRDFIHDWSNGPFLVRTDSGRLLTERDLGPSGSEARYCAWDRKTGGISIYDPESGGYDRSNPDLALSGTFTVSTAGGDVPCRPVFGLYAELCGRYTSEVVEAACWVEPGQVEEAAELIWASRPTAYYAYSGHEHHANTTQTARAMSLLYALTGSFDKEGGNVLLPSVPSAPIAGKDLPVGTEMAPIIGLAERPLGPARWNAASILDFYNAILDEKPYPVKGLIGFGSNILLAHLSASRGREALAKLDFYAHADMFMNPTAAYADVVLPVSSPFEREGLKVGFEVSLQAQSHVQLRAPLIQPPGECRSDTEIVFDLAQRLGLGEHFWDGDIEAGLRCQLAPSGLMPDELRESPGGIQVPLEMRYAKYAEPEEDGRPRGFPTPSRKVEIWSETFRAAGFDPLPDYVEPELGPVARPDLAERYPLILTNAKNTLFCNSQHRSLPSLRKRDADPAIELHPETAAQRGISSGDWVRVESPEGSIRVRAQFNASLDPRIVVGQHGWWQACKDLGMPDYNPFDPEGANLNLLIGTESLDPVSGTPPLKSTLCEVSALA